MEIQRRDIENGIVYVSYLDDVSMTIRDDAIEQARSKLSISLSLEQLLKDNRFIGYLKYGLATGIAEALAANDARVQAIYLYDPSDDLEMTLHLIVETSASSAALDAFIESLDQALTRCMRDLPSPLLEGRTFIMDVNMVTEEEVRHRVGYAAFLSSMFAPALKIWKRGN